MVSLENALERPRPRTVFIARSVPLSKVFPLLEESVVCRIGNGTLECPNGNCFHPECRFCPSIREKPVLKRQEKGLTRNNPGP